MKTIEEGNVRIEVPDVDMPGEGEVFYNPHMALARDISFCIYSQFEGTMCDALAASGVRGLRLSPKLKVTMNDANCNAAELMRKNAKLNNADVEVLAQNANALLSERRFDIVDLDPFGSPVPFLDNACRSAKKILGICATDTPPLTGVWPKVCERRYLAKPLHSEYLKEFAVRILCGYAVRNAAKYDIALRPIFVHSTRHYFRAYFEVDHGAEKANELLESIGTWRDGKKGPESDFGPVWLGELWDAAVVDRAIEIAETSKLAKPEQALKLLRMIKDEIGAPIFYQDVHGICAECKMSPVPMETLLPLIQGVRTHFSPTAVKTSLSREKIAEVIRKIAR